MNMLPEEKKEIEKEVPQKENAQPPAEAKKTEQEQMIPKTRFDEINEAKKKAELELEAYRKAEEDRKQADLTETEKAKHRAERAEAEAKELKTKQAQRDAAEKVGLPTAFADRVKGDTPEAMEADARMLLENMPKAPKKPGPTPASSPAEGTQATTDDERRKFLFG
jgi:hypothetical protein